MEQPATHAAPGAPKRRSRLASHHWLAAAVVVLALTWMKACEPVDASGLARSGPGRAVAQAVRYALWRARLMHE